MEIGKQQFVAEVFPAELAEIRRRRVNAGDPRRIPDSAETTPPSTANGLVGLAFSGGGIRSASFSMGVVQQLISKRLFASFDYLSTVSGGGYTGSCLSTLMQGGKDGERLLVDRDADNEPAALNRVRNRSNYLVPQGLLNRLRLPALFLTGFLHTLLMLLPSIVLLVFATELFFELTSHILPGTRHWLATLGLVPLALAVLIRPLQAGRGSWAHRDRADRRLGGYLLLAGGSILAVPTLKWLGGIVNNDATWIVDQLETFATTQVELGVGGGLFWAGLVAVLFVALGVMRFRARLILMLIAVLGPLVVLTIYVVACIYAINSPVNEDSNFGLRAALAELGKHGSRTTTSCGSDTISAQQLRVQEIVAALLTTKQIDPRVYQIQWNSTATGNEVMLLRCGEETPRWVALLTTQGRTALHIEFESDWRSVFRANTGEPDLIVIRELALLRGNAEWWMYLGALLLWLYNHFLVNVNLISMHSFYRDRLSRTFLSVPKDDGFAPRDDLKLSELGGPASSAPYHLVNTALNLQGSNDPQLRDRRTVPFVLAQRYCGSDYTGYCSSRQLEALDPHFNLGTAMAISAAAAAPNMGTVTVRSLTFVMTLLNIRLNYWLPHPARTGARHSWWARATCGQPGLRYLLSEAFGNVDDRSAFINCSDGGHIENLAVYELLKRRCQTIVCVDGEADPSFSFFGLITLQRYAEIDLGARIEIDLSGIRANKRGRSEHHYALGTIRYSDGEEGTFIYLKLSYSGDEPEYVHFYKAQSPVFPHESTGDQFFEETQFEVYRALGFHVADKIAADPMVIDKLSRSEPIKQQPPGATR